MYSRVKASAAILAYGGALSAWTAIISLRLAWRVLRSTQ